MGKAFDLMVSGAPFDASEPELQALRAQCDARKAALDAVPTGDGPGRQAAMRSLFGSMNGLALVIPPFTLEYGVNIHLGDWVFVNSGATFLDSAPITLGARAMIGPNVQFITATHPLRFEDRQLPRDGDRIPPFEIVTTARPITVGAKAWIGAGTILLPGVEIGEGAVVGAGSVVTKSVPPRMLALGNPARVIRSVDA